MERRHLLKALPAVGIAAAVSTQPAIAVADPDARLTALMVVWQAQYRLCSASRFVGEIDDDAEWQQLVVIERQIAATPPSTMQGLAIKLLVATNYDEFDLDGANGTALLREAEGLCGFGPPFEREA